MDDLICSAHQACGVKPAQEERCSQILPCPAWRVNAVKYLGGREADSFLWEMSDL